MADQKLSGLPALGAPPAEDDEVYLRDVSEAGADQRKRLSMANFRKTMGRLLELIDYRETMTGPNSSAGTLTLDLELGNTFHVNLLENVTTLTINNWPSSGVAATGSFDLNDMAAADTLDTVLVNGVDLLDGSPVTFDTDLDITGDAIVAEIDGNTTTPNYTATHDGSGIVTIVGIPARGVLDNGLVVDTTETGFTVTSKTNMSGGTDSVAGSLTLILRQDTVGGRTFNWGAVAEWAGGIAPTISSAANAKDIFTLVKDGDTVYGMTGGQDFS
jgi:hypothetical protein